MVELSAEDLCDFLQNMSQGIKKRQLEALANQLMSVKQYAVGSTSELLGEARLALQDMLRQYEGKLTKSEISASLGMIKKIDAEFKRVNSQ